MKQVGYNRFGNPSDVVEVMERPDPGPVGADEALVAVEAAPINPADLLAMQGRYGKELPALPAFCGHEGVGRVIEVGSDVKHLSTGDRVSLLRVGQPTWAERVKAPATALIPLPEGGDPLQFAMVGANPMTAWAMLWSEFPVETGQWVIQNAGNSAVGRCVTQLATASGIGVISVVRRPEAAEDLQPSDSHHVLVDGDDLPERVAAITGDAPPVKAFDAVAGDATCRLGRTLAESGIILNYGLLSGEPCAVRAEELVFRDVRLRGFWLARWVREQNPDDVAEMLRRLMELMHAGALRVPVEATYTLDQARDAITHAASSRRGKILFKPDSEGAGVS